MDDFFTKFAAKVFLQEEPNPERQLRGFENRFGTKIPRRLREILVQCAGSVVFDRVVSFKPMTVTGWEGRRGTVAISIIFGPSDDSNGLLKNKLTYADQLPHDLTPFAGLGGGNLLCYDDKTGAILFWDHESPPDKENIFMVAENFSDFEAQLNVESDPVQRDFGVVKVDLKF